MRIAGVVSDLDGPHQMNKNTKERIKTAKCLVVSFPLKLGGTAP